MADLCPVCHHGWHGLSCEIIKIGLDKNHKLLSGDVCACPPQFVDKNEIPVLHEGERYAPRKAW